MAIFNINFSFTKTLNINNNADGKTYIVFPSKTTIGTISKSGFTASSGETTTSNVITYNDQLAWGSYFGGQNPSLLTNPKEVDSYIAGLKHLKDCLKDNATFEINVNIEKK